MAKRPEDKPPDQSWMLTFCDCMTLLLCFFVLLLSFSSFDEMKFDTLRGAFHSMSFDWLDFDPDQPKTSIMERKDPKDFPRQGPTIPTNKEDTDKPNRAPIELLDLDLYQDRTVFYLPSQRFFWGQGVNLTSDGKDYLHFMAAFLHKFPCRIVVSESSGITNRNLGLRRAWSVLRWLTTRENLDSERFTITTQSNATFRFGPQGVLEITLMNVQVEE
jgi:hypothetical protein